MSITVAYVDVLQFGWLCRAKVDSSQIKSTLFGLELKLVELAKIHVKHMMLFL